MSPWFEKKKKKIHVYVVLGLLGLEKKKKIHVYVVLGLLGLKKKKITQSLLTERLWGQKEIN